MVGAAARQPTAVLVVSAWYEGAPPRLAARITSTLDVTRPERVVVVVAGEEDDRPGRAAVGGGRRRLRGAR